VVAVTSLASCRAFGKAICAEFKELSVLCLNAGRGGAKGSHTNGFAMPPASCLGLT